MPAGDKHVKTPDQDAHLRQLLELVKAPPAARAQLPPLKYTVGKRSRLTSETASSQPSSGTTQNAAQEAAQLEHFRDRYKDERQFSSRAQHQLFLDVCVALTKHRLCSQEWLSHAPPEHILLVLMCLRILLRDSSYQKHFFELDGIKSLVEYFQRVTDEYLYSTNGLISVDILQEMTNIFQKLSASVDRCDWLIRYKTHLPLVRLLTATDVFVLHCSLYALIGLAQSPGPRSCIAELNAVEMLLRIIQEYDTISKKLAANLLRCLCDNQQTREKVKMEDGIPLLISQLASSDNVSLLWHVVWCLVLLCDDAECRVDISQFGGIPLILSLLHERKFVSERTDASNTAVASAGVHRKPMQAEELEEFIDEQFNLRKACCAALTELVLTDSSAQQIVQANGLYALGLLILPQEVLSEKERKRATKLQQNAFRALRFLFSMERNRRLFKQWFPADLFEMFIDVGHYNRDLNAYKPLADKINCLQKEEVNKIYESICNTNQNKAATRHIREFAVFELLGTGAFGAVYKVQKKTGRQSFLALKEVNLQNAAFGKNDKEKAKSVGEITYELRIMKEEMRHPNVVRYYKTFEIEDKLYIVMELIEGAALEEHCKSLKEKKDRFEEARIWSILLQLMLALRYLHKEKGIVHRDLTANNIMLGENDKVTITDFGLAKQKRSDCSKMMSVVGTMLYCCPEVVQSQAYGEKADIWALGCILYQMCMLEPPFFSSNMLTLVNKIVAADYTPIPEKDYSARLIETVKRCLTISPDHRPDILALSSELSNMLLVQMDSLRITQTALERKLDKERKRTQKHFLETNQSMQQYHNRFPTTHEGYDQLTNLAGSGGSQGLKESSVSGSPAEPSDSVVGPNVAVSMSSIRLGDVSDEDSYPSSGSESRESSAGSLRSHPLPVPPVPLRRRAPPRPVKKPDMTLSDLAVEIPAAAKASRDSGLSSGDPSPIASQSSSMQGMESLLNGRAGHLKNNFMRSFSTNEVSCFHQHGKMEKRSRSAAMLTVSPNRMREISDPVQQMLHQLHKLIYITQLPPTLSPNSNRRIIEQYKRALFSPHSSAVNLKNEMMKLMQGSRDLIDLNLGPLECLKRSSVNGELDSPIDPDKPATPQYDPDYKDVGITYEYMQTILEAALDECGYYKTTLPPAT
ncbi:serine/threonine-protein kinase Nek10 [Aplysia californica]|uniref:Serine/threonine-protein kinase Nek10 n=1 Tax=Aplysia californica TaxID=6500 RepID=A0ABM1VSV4_APLCA|nr:serine/threonine-protein kinase Nek10 [Aplysia californica]